jgi:hypothetical protein
MSPVRVVLAKNIKSVMENKKFEVKLGQTDYTNIRWAPVINCVLEYKDKYLGVQRNSDLNFYPNYWNGISGFLDDQKSLKEKVLEELEEELNISKENIENIKLGEIFNQEESKYKKTWIVHPVLVKIKTNKINLNWEAINYKWATLQEINELKLLPGFKKVLENLSLNNI